MDTFIGTPAYIAPEIVQKEKYTEKVDIWSLGVIAFIMILNRIPFNLSNDRIIYKQVVSKELDFSLKAGVS
jgi:serine/threonine protein kinase